MSQNPISRTFAKMALNRRFNFNIFVVVDEHVVINLFHEGEMPRQTIYERIVLY